jgi:hypothetical protein
LKVEFLEINSNLEVGAKNVWMFLSGRMKELALGPTCHSTVPYFSRVDPNWAIGVDLARNLFAKPAGSFGEHDTGWEQESHAINCHFTSTFRERYQVVDRTNKP